MKQNYPFQKSSYLLCMIISWNLSAQRIIVEQTKTAPGSTVKYKHNFNKQNYTRVLDENGKKVYTANNQPGQNNTPNGEDDIENVTLNIDLVFDSDQYSAPLIIQVFDETGYMYFASWEGINPVSLEVPPGSYDIIAGFSGGVTSHIVIKELIDVQETTTIEVNAAEAANFITTAIYNESGETLEPGLYDPDTGTTSGGNAEVVADRSLFFAPLNYSLMTYSFIWGFRFSENEEPVWNFYINDVSERYSIIQTIFGSGYEGDNYFSTYETLTGISESAALENNPEDWVFHREKFQPSVLGEAAGAVYPGFSTINSWEGNGSGGWTVYNTLNEYNPEEGIKAYLNNPLGEDPSNLLVFPAIVDYMGIMDYGWGEEVFFTTGNSINAGYGNEVIYGSGGSSYGAPYFLTNDFHYTENKLKVLPFHSRFTFNSADNPAILQGDNTPIAISAFTWYGLLKAQYKGRYGETRESDFFNTNVEIKQNSQVVFSGSYIEFRQFSIPNNGLIETAFTNINVEADGLSGKNITRVTFDRSREDSNPPTLQMLQFRNTSGKVTDRFSFAGEGTVRLAAGDFKLNLNPLFYDYVEGNTVELFYSVYDQNEWTNLALTEYPEHFLMPAFGDYYEASLAGIADNENDVWYDVKIICTDAAGNIQEQVVSPAFLIESNLSVQDNSLKELSIYPNPFLNQLNIQLPETLKGNYTFKVTDLSGKTVYAEQRNTDAAKTFAWDGSHLPKGVYVFSIVSGNQVVAKKVIKK